MKPQHWSIPSMIFLAGALGPAALAQQPNRNMPYVRVEKAYPTGDRNSSILLIERMMPADVRRGEVFTYEVRVTNITRAPLQDLTVTEQLPPTFRAQSITPQPTQAGERASWFIKELPAGASQAIQIAGSTDRPEEMTGCTSVAFSTGVCSSTKVVEPKLMIAKTMPEQVIICDDIPIRIVVTNTGSGVARGVRVTDKLPDGLTTKDGRTDLVFDAGDLGAGQSKEAVLTAKATKTGELCNTARAVEAGGLAAEATACVRVRQPQLAVTKAGPNLRYLGRPATFEITVRNTGDIAAQRTVLTDIVPPGTEFIGASDGGQMSGGRVTWALGDMPAGAARTVQLTLRPNQIGKVTNTATAQAYCAEATATAQMDVMGVPAVLLEVVDIADPIEVGAQETYEITVTNQGTAPDSNIVITVTLPAEQDYVSDSGPTKARAEGKTITFGPLPMLAPKARATWKVVTRGTQPGDSRLKVVMTTDQTTSPVEETESTHVYE